jgi:hypothetical protein
MGTYPGPVMGTYPGPIVGTFPRGPYRGFGPYYGRPRYAAPYYHFRPRATVGGGLWLGYPVPFPQMRYAAPFMYVYPYPVAPYGYTTPYPPTHSAYPPLATPIYPPGTSLDDPAPPRDTGVAVSPPPTGFGGMSLDLTPADAEVWVDGGFTGMADDFGPQRDPLTLTPGVHRIELRAPGYVTALFDVTINAGQVLPYQGGLKPVP